MEQITKRQATLMGGMFILNSTLISVPSQAIGHAKQHAWLSLLLASGVILVSLMLLAQAVNRFPDQNLMEALKNRFPILGRCIVMVYVMFFFFILVRDVRLVVNFCNISLLPTTPLVVIAFLVVLTISLISRSGLSSVARLTELFAVQLFLVVLSLPLILAKDANISWIKPIYHVHWKGVFEGSWYYFSYVGEIIAMPLISTGRSLHLRQAWLGWLLGVSTIMIITVMDLLVLGPNLTPRIMYPTYELVRQIRITDFLDRLDLPLVGIWLPAMLIKISYSLYLVSYGINKIMPGIKRKPIVFSLGAFSLPCASWFFSNTVQMLHFNKAWTAVAIIPELVIPILLFFILKPKSKSMKTH